MPRDHETRMASLTTMIGSLSEYPQHRADRKTECERNDDGEIDHSGPSRGPDLPRLSPCRKLAQQWPHHRNDENRHSKCDEIAHCGVDPSTAARLPLVPAKAGTQSIVPGFPLARG